MCWVGARSYALYLIHLPVYHAAVELWSRLNPAVLKSGGGHTLILLATALPPIFLLADLNYRFVEVPLRRRGARLAERIRNRAQPVDAAVAQAVA
jgi:peptidoglycan/LPS O-acetylase OafA/YrhL